MALSYPLLLLLLFLTSVHSDPLRCADTQESYYSPVNLTEVLGKWNLIAGAYVNAQVLTRDKQLDFAWIKISSHDGVTNYTYTYASSSSLIASNRNDLEVSEEPDGLTFKAMGNKVLTVKGKVSKDCIAMTVPDGGDVGLILTCKFHKAPKLVVEDFIRHAACQNFHFTNERENAINYAYTCEEILQKDPLKDFSKITGRWILVAKASPSQRSSEVDDNHVDGWIDITAHGHTDVTITQSPDTTDVKEIKEGKYTTGEKLLYQHTDDGPLLMTVYETCPDELLLHVNLVQQESSNLFLLTKSGTIQSLEKENFKKQALCSLLPHVYGIPAEQHKEKSASTCKKILRKDPLEDRNEISGRWMLVAKATSYDRCPCMQPDEVDGWIEFVLHDDQVTVTRSPDSVDMEEVPVERDYYNGLNSMTLQRDGEIVQLAPFKTCPGDFLILHLVKLLRNPPRTTLMLLSRTGTAPAYMKEKFKARARCDGLRNVYGIPDDQYRDLKDI